MISERRNREARDYHKSGSTVTAVVIEDGLFIHWAWVGDSRAILCRNGVAKRLTFDHGLEHRFNPIRESEITRIEKAGGIVRSLNDQHRIHARIDDKELSINMTRSLGDIRMKKFGVISEPSSMTELPLGDPDYARITRINHSTDALLTIITDGVSGPMPVNEIVALINSRNTAHDSARHLVDTALLLGSDDNCTAIVIPLGAWGKYKDPSSSVNYNRNFIGSFNRG